VEEMEVIDRMDDIYEIEGMEVMEELVFLSVCQCVAS